MGQVSVTLFGRTFRFHCGDGEENRLVALADMVAHRIRAAEAKAGCTADERVMVMVALELADELAEAKEQLARLSAPKAPGTVAAPVTHSRIASGER